MNQITLSTINNFTLQQIIEFVAYALLKQGKKSHVGFSFAYRGEDGLRCAVGFCISDDEYVPEMEGKTLRQATRGPFDSYHVTSERISLLDSLQVIHDARDVSQWEDAILKLARDSRLDDERVYVVIQLAKKERSK